MRGWENVTEDDLKNMSYNKRREKPIQNISNKPNTNKRKNKYNSSKTSIGCLTFDSKKEANYYEQLLMLKHAGIVKDIVLQKDFTLQEAFTKENGERIRAIRYRCDFAVKYADGHEEIIDVKGKRTKEYILKKKMLLEKYPDIDFKEV